MTGETIKTAIESVAEPESQSEQQEALKRLTFSSNDSTNSDPNTSSCGGTAMRIAEDVSGERPSASGTSPLETPTSSRQGSAEVESPADDAGNVEDRMKRWADRREQKKKQAALRKKTWRGSQEEGSNSTDARQRGRGRYCARSPH